MLFGAKRKQHKKQQRAAYAPTKRKSKRKTKPRHKNPKDFYATRKWRKLRRIALLICGRTCLRCGSTTRPEVDHIQCRSKHKDLQYDITNLQVLCHKCNWEKLDKWADDFRTPLMQQKAEKWKGRINAS